MYLFCARACECVSALLCGGIKGQLWFYGSCFSSFVCETQELRSWSLPAGSLLQASQIKYLFLM